MIHCFSFESVMFLQLTATRMICKNKEIYDKFVKIYFITADFISKINSILI